MAFPVLTRQEANILVSDIKDDIHGNFANRGDLAEDTIYRYMTMAQNRIAATIDWPFLLQEYTISHSASGSLGDETIELDDPVESNLSTTFNSTHRRIKSIEHIQSMPDAEQGVTNENRIRMRRVTSPAVWYKDIKDHSVTPNQPTHWFWWYHNTIRVAPLPDKNYAFFVLAQFFPAEINAANSGDNLEIVNAEEAVLCLATSMIAARLKLEKLSAFWLEQYTAALLPLTTITSSNGASDMAAIRHEGSAESNLVGEYWKDPFSQGPNGGEQVI